MTQLSPHSLRRQTVKSLTKYDVTETTHRAVHQHPHDITPGGSLPLFPNVYNNDHIIKVRVPTSFLNGVGLLYPSSVVSLSKTTDASFPTTHVTKRADPSGKTSKNTIPPSPPLAERATAHPQDAPGREPPRTLEVKKKSTVVRFRNVQLHYYNDRHQEQQEQRQPLPSSLVVGLDDYERQRGPARPPRCFVKSPAELRSIRRLRQIQDNLAAEEWKATRQAQRVAEQQNAQKTDQHRTAMRREAESDDRDALVRSNAAECSKTTMPPEPTTVGEAHWVPNRSGSIRTRMSSPNNVNNRRKATRLSKLNLFRRLCKRGNEPSLVTEQPSRTRECLYFC